LKVPPVVVGVGVDLADPARLAAALARRAGLAGRLLTPAEDAAIASGELSVAQAFAVKEAVMKALGQGLGRIAFTDITVGARSPGVAEAWWFTVQLLGPAAARARELGIDGWEVSAEARDSMVLARAVALGSHERA
jgi:phosphopantetheine--protein transferase-like protein